MRLLIFGIILIIVGIVIIITTKDDYTYAGCFSYLAMLGALACIAAGVILIISSFASLMLF